MPSMDELIALVALHIDSDELKAFRESQPDLVDEPPEPGRMPGFLICKPGGYSITYARKKPDHVNAVHIYLDGADGYESYTGALRAGLSSGADIDAVRAAWGEPTRSGADEDGTPWWDRFDSDEICIHVRYRDGGQRFDLLTLMDPATAP